MSALSDFLEGELVNHIFRTATFTKPTTLAIALCTAAPVDADTGSLTNKEVANTFSYARATLNPSNSNWNAAGTNGLTDNAVSIVFTTASGGSWGTITHVAILDSTTYGGGNLYFHGSLTTSKVVGDGDTIQFNTGSLDITFS